MQIRYFSSTSPASVTRAELVRVWFGPFADMGETEPALEGKTYNGTNHMHIGMTRSLISQGGTSVPIVKLQGSSDANSAMTAFKTTTTANVFVNMSTLDPQYDMSFNSRNQWIFQPNPDERDRFNIGPAVGDDQLGAGWHIWLENYSGIFGAQYNKGLLVTMGVVWNEYK